MLVPTSSNSNRTIFLRVANGSILQKTKEGKEITFQSISGSIKSIVLKENTIENKKFQNWHIILTDASAGESYDLSMPRSSGAFKGVVRCLVTPQGMENLDDVRIDIYMSKNGFANSVTYAGGEKLHWTEEEMPKTQKVIVSGQEVTDDTAQINWIMTLVDRINARIQENSQQETPPAENDAEDTGDMPDYGDMPE